MKLRIFTPLALIVDEDIASLRATDTSGSFGILPGHVPFVTALAVSIISWRQASQERFCAVRGGVLTVADDTTISVASREAVVGDDLSHLDTDVLDRFAAEAEAEKVEHIETMRIQMNAIRQMISRLKPRENKESFR